MEILVVEDHEAIRKMIESLIGGRGHTVVGVRDGSKALDAASLSKPDLVLLDINLPGKYDGLQVCEKLRAAETTRNVPIIVISARDDSSTRARAIAVGANAFYGKPFSPTALLSDIERLGRTARA